MKFKLINQKVETEDQRRKIQLGTFLIVFYLLIDLFFFLVNLFNPQGIPSLLISGVLVSAVSFLLLRRGKTELALFLYLLRANIIVFYFAQQEDLSTGTFLHFISYGLIPLAFFGYADRWKGIVYSSFTFLLFLISEFRWVEFSPDQAHFYFIINFGIVLLVTGFIFLFFDRINIQAEQVILKRNQELAQANDELDRFVYSASHDLRAPLTSIMGLVNVYKLTNTEEEKNKIVNLIADRSQKLDGFIKEILTYSRNSRVGVILKPIQLRLLIEECIESLKYNPGFELIQFQLEISPSRTIASDAQRLKVVLLNLLSNAIKYRDPAKPQSYLKIYDSIESTSLKIIVEDNGVGIDKEYLPQIFGMFFRAHHHSEGSGLGLYIASESIKKLSGQLEVTSEVGKGSSFIAILPNK